MTYAEAESLLLAMPRFADVGAAAMKPGLARMTRLLEAMGDPHHRWPSVHVAGTNGKGSTASLLAGIASSAERRTGLHTSPHLEHLGERMRIGGSPAPPEWIAEAVRRNSSLFDEVEPSFFEATTALAFQYFAEEEVDLAVIEVGLGGRLDATNVLKPVLSIVTRVALDHEAVLGSTLEVIAREKAGIAKPGIPLLTSVEPGPVLDALREEATLRDAEVEAIPATCAVTVTQSSPTGLMLDLVTPQARYEKLEVGLVGQHQAWNAAMAVRAAERLGLAEGAIRDGLRDVQTRSGLAGRCEVVSENPLIVVDVAHNPDGIAAALRMLREFAPGRRFVAIGLMADKAIDAVAALLASADLTVLPVPLAGDRALPAESLAARLRHAGANVEHPTSVHQALLNFSTEARPGDGLLVTGSHLAAAEARSGRRTPR